MVFQLMFFKWALGNWNMKCVSKCMESGERDKGMMMATSDIIPKMKYHPGWWGEWGEGSGCGETGDYVTHKYQQSQPSVF